LRKREIVTYWIGGWVGPEMARMFGEGKGGELKPVQEIEPDYSAEAPVF